MALIGEMKYLTIGSNTYEIPTSELPIASSSTLGGIKVGSGLAIDSSTGVLNIASSLPYVVELEYVGSGDGSSSIWQSTETVAEVKTKIDNSTVVILKAGHDFLYFNSYDRGNDLHFYGGMDNNLVAYPNSGQNNTWAIEQIDETIYWDDIVDKPTIPTISITRNLTSGTKSATINVDGTDYDIYSTDDTKNTAGSTDDTTNSLYIIGATSQGANPQTYSNKNFHIRGSYLYLGYNGTTTVTGLCFYYGSYYATMVYGGAITGDTYTPILKFSSATPANGVVLRNIANPRNDEDAVNRGYLISALSNKVSDYSFKTEDNYKQVINLENYSGGFNISSTVYPDEEGTVVNATRWLNARFYDGALAIKAVDFTENNTSFNGYLAINKDEVNLGKINNNVVTSYIKIDNNGTTIKNVVTPTANTDAANKQYVDNKFSSITFPVTSVNGQTGAVTVVEDDHKWGGVTLGGTGANTAANSYVPVKDSIGNTSGTAGWATVTSTPTSYNIAKYDDGPYLYSTTPTSSDSSTKVATTAFVASAVSGISVPTASSTTPAMDGTAATGSETTFARGDHVHPTDTSRAATTVVTTQASIGSDGLITYKNSGNTSLYTVQLPLFDGGTGSSSSLYLPLTGGSLSGNLSIGGTTTSTGLITGNGGISTTVLTTSSNATVGGNLSVSGTTTSTGLLTASGGISTTTLTTSGNTTVGGTLSVSGATILGSTLGVTGATILNNTLNVTGITTLGNTLDVTGATTLGSTLDVTGDTTVNGVLDVKKFRCLKLLSAAGWYRVLTATPLTIASGAIVKFKILQYGDGNTNSVNHEVTLSFNKSGINFRDESSDGVQYVTKIRVNQLSSGYAVDIYYSDTTGRTIDVFFEPYIYAPYRNRFSANSLESVADSPADETIKTVYDFHDSGMYFNDLSVGGVLDVAPRRSYAYLTSAGWYRVMKYAAADQNEACGMLGAVIDLTFTRRRITAGEDSHCVKLMMVLNNIVFSDESSHSLSGYQRITKVRYTNNGTTSYVDVYYSGGGNSYLGFDFVAHVPTAIQSSFSAVGFTSVGDSPSGETILAEYSFAANTYGFEAATKDSNFSATTFNLNAYRRGDVFVYYYNIRVPALSAETEVTMGTFSSLAPPTALNQTAAGQEGGAYLLQFKTNGTVTIYSTNGAPVQFVRGTITIPVIH